MTTKICSSCKIEKPITDFYKNKHKKDGYMYACKECESKRDSNSLTRKSSKKLWREKNKEKIRLSRKPKQKVERKKKYINKKDRELTKKFGITLSSFEEMMINQESKCAICGIEEAVYKKILNQTLAVDHCHKTGKIRGLLCGNCNRALGLFKDNIDTLKQAIIYLS